MTSKETLVEAMLTAAREGLLTATRATRRLQGQVDAITKADGSPVTIADLTSQALMLRALSAARPDLPVLAEERFPDDDALAEQVLAAVRTEHADATVEALRGWVDHGRPADAAAPLTTPDGLVAHLVLDPIDGTKGFLAGEQYAIAVALIVDGQPAAAAMACPNLGPDRTPWLFFTDGTRAWRETLDAASQPTGAREDIRVSDVTDGAQGRPLESRSKGHSDRSLQASIYGALGMSEDRKRQMDGMGKYALVACGEAELYMRLPHPSNPDRPEHSWDHAAGALLVQAAGGRATGACGNPIDASGLHLKGTHGVLATNGAIHDDAVRAIAAALASA